MGTECRLELELKTLADLGLIGYPNAGKSSLLSVISVSAICLCVRACARIFVRACVCVRGSLTVEVNIRVMFPDQSINLFGLASLVSVQMWIASTNGTRTMRSAFKNSFDMCEKERRWRAG